MKRLLALLAVLAGSLAAAAPVPAGEVATTFAEIDENEHLLPKYAVEVGFAYRLDDPEYHDYVPSECIRVYYRLVSPLQLRLGVLHNSFTRLSSRTSYHTIAADLSLKVRFDHRWLSPYIESGVWMPVYWGIDDGRRYDDDHPGLRIAAGMSFRFSPTVSLEAGVSQVLNYIDDDYIVAAPMPPLGGGGYYRREAPNGAYNEACFEAGLCVGL